MHRPTAAPRRSVIRRLALGLGAIVLLISLLAIGIAWAINDQNQRERDIFDNSEARLRLTETIRSAMVDQESGLRGFIIAGDEQYLEPFNSGRSEYELARDELAGLPRLSDEAARLRDEQFRLAEQWYTEIAVPLIDAQRAGSLSPETRLAQLDRGKDVFDAFRDANAASVSATQSDVDAARADLDHDGRVLLAAAGTGGVVAVAATIVVGLLLIRSIRAPLRQLGGIVEAAEAGDLQQRVPHLPAIEFDRLGQGVNLMLESLGHIYADAEAERARLETILESASEGIVVIDAAGTVTTFNPAAASMFGTPADAILGRPARDLKFLSDDEISATLSGPENSKESPGAQAIVRKRGELVLSALASPLVSASGHTEGGAVWVVRDVTELARIDEMRNEFVSIVSHELRSPLTSIKGFTDLLLEGDAGELNESQREFLEIVQSNSDRLVALINDMLDLSRIESGRLVLALDEIDLEQAIDHAVISFMPMLENKRLTLQTEIPPDSMLVVADEQRLQQILANLISNAAKYTPTGGWITIRAAPAGDRVAVSVSDTGIGIPADALPRVFSKFFRTDQAATRQIGGTGLGLAITRSLVELHRGGITIASRVNVGTTVRFTLPSANRALLDEAGGSIGMNLLAGVRLLVASDRPEAPEFGRGLEERGFTVGLVADGLTALVRAIEQLPDVILLDAGLPRMSPEELLRQLRANPGTRDTPVLVIVGDDTEERARFLTLGATDVLSREVDPEALSERLTRLAGSRRVGRDSA